MKRVLSVLFTIVLLAGCASTTPVGTQPDRSASSATASEVSSQAVASAVSSETASSQIVKKELPAAPEMEKGWWKKALEEETLDNHEFGMKDGLIYLTDNSICTDIRSNFGTSPMNTDFSLLLNTAKEVEDIGKPLGEPAFFEIILWDDTIYRGVFYERGIALTPIMPGKQEGKEVLLEIDSGDYQKIIASVGELFHKAYRGEELYNIPTYYAAIFSRLRFCTCSSIKMSSFDGRTMGVFTPNTSWKLRGIFDGLRSLPVMLESRECVDKSVTLSEAANAHMEFMDGSSCDLQCDGKTLIISYSEDKDAVQYKLYSDILKKLDLWTSGAFIPETGKPVIYLYPQQPTDVTVKVDYKGQFTYTYPAYNNGWQVTAYPDGHLVNKADGSEHYYLFWEGNAGAYWRFDEGFVVKGEDTERFLINALKTMGLTPREYNDFIVYWLPEMQHSPYNLITFATDEYEQLAPLTVTPKPDSILRVHMVYRALNEPVEIREQKLTPFERKGFTVVEWGGTRG